MNKGMEKEYKYLIKESVPRIDEERIVLVCDTEEYAREYIAKFDKYNYFRIVKIPYENRDLSKIAVKHIIITADGENIYNSYTSTIEDYEFHSHVAGASCICYVEDNSFEVDGDKVKITVIANKILEDDEMRTILKNYSDKIKELLPPKYTFKIGDEVVDTLGDKAYVIKVFSDKADDLFVLIPNTRKEKLISTKAIKPTGRFSSTIAKVFSTDYDIEVDE